MSAFLTHATWHLALSVIWSLGRKHIKVISGDVAHNFYFKSKYCHQYVCYPDPKSDAFVNALYDIIKQTRSEVLIPMGNTTLIPIAKNKRLLEEITAVPIPDFDIVMKAYDKYECTCSAAKLDIPIPQTYLVQTDKELERISHSLDYPAIIKPRESEGSAKGVLRINSPEELKKAYENIKAFFGDAIVQEFIPGGSTQMRMVNVLYNEDTELVAVFTAKKLREYPPMGGITTFGESIWDPTIVEMGQKLFEAWKWYGVAEIEFKVDPRDNTPKLIEINPRFWSYLQLPIYCGVDFPYLLYKISLGERVRHVDRYKVGVKYMHLKDIPSSLNLIQSGGFRAFFNVLNSYRGEKTYAMFSWSDPKPIIGKIFFELKENLKLN